MTLIKYITALIIAALTLSSCGDQKSLQRYLVDKQEDDRFVKLDLATSLLQNDEADFTEEQKDILNSIKKVNVVAYPLKKGNPNEYESEKSEVKEIISQEKYKTLMKMGSNNSGATLKYLGEEDAIDEVIVFASDDERGFAVFRLLGEDMQVGEMMKLMTSIDKGDLDVEKLSGIGDLFKDI